MERDFFEGRSWKENISKIIEDGGKSLSQQSEQQTEP